ncbi:MAG: hypothetical protein ACPH2J_08045 [Akkermansiaceae bacterium]
MSRFIILTRKCLLAAAVAALSMPSLSAASEEEMAAQIAALEKRLAQLESRLSVNEMKTKEAKVLATNTSNAAAGNNATLNILSNSAWRNLRWTDADQWKTVVNGASIAHVEDALGKPPRTVKSLKPQIDLVYFYETSIGQKDGLYGKIAFRKGKVIAVTQPDFSKNLSGN